jgi:hypothetical protein
VWVVHVDLKYLLKINKIPCALLLTKAIFSPVWF